MREPELVNKRLDASCRVAMAGLWHDLGKFAERGRVGADHPRLDRQRQLVCPRKTHPDANFKSWTHAHAAYTGIQLDELEALLPKLVDVDVAPFGSSQDRNHIDDSLANAAAMHHKPETFLQWVIATADRVASGFERNDFDAYNAAEEQPDHYQARLLSQLEQIELSGGKSGRDRCKYAYPLLPLSPSAILPARNSKLERSQAAAQTEYAELWRGFVAGVKSIPEAHRQTLPVWLD